MLRRILNQNRQGSGSLTSSIFGFRDTSVTSVTNHRTYNAFGKLTAETNSAVDLLFGFTGKQLDDATGLQHNLFRWYDSNIGQWMSEDPAGFAGWDENLRRYVSGMSTDYTDASGLRERQVHMAPGVPAPLCPENDPDVFFVTMPSMNKPEFSVWNIPSDTFNFLYDLLESTPDMYSGTWRTLSQSAIIAYDHAAYSINATMQSLADWDWYQNGGALGINLSASLGEIAPTGPIGAGGGLTGGVQVLVRPIDWEWEGFVYGGPFVGSGTPGPSFSASLGGIITTPFYDQTLADGYSGWFGGFSGSAILPNGEGGSIAEDFGFDRWPLDPNAVRTGIDAETWNYSVGTPGAGIAVETTLYATWRDVWNTFVGASDNSN